MNTLNSLEFHVVKKAETALIEEFLLDDGDIEIAEFNRMKLLVIPFRGVAWEEQLVALHDYFTEHAPYLYYGITYKLVKNYSSGKTYSATGEGDLPLPRQKLLKFILQDGTYIFIKRNNLEQCEKILISVNGTDSESLEQHTKEVEQTLLDFIHTFDV